MKNEYFYISSFIESIILWTLDWKMSDEPWTVDGTVVHYQQNNRWNEKYTRLAGKWHVLQSEHFFFYFSSFFFLQMNKTRITHKEKEDIRHPFTGHVISHNSSISQHQHKMMTVFLKWLSVIHLSKCISWTMKHVKLLHSICYTALIHLESKNTNGILK